MSRPWMPLYVGDYLGDTRRLTTLQHGAYMLLIMEYWQNGGLPDDDEELAQIAGLSQDQWQAMRPKIAALFLDGWKHKRIEAELTRADEKSAKAKESAGKRWQSNGNANAMPSHSERISERNADADANAMLLQPQVQSEKKERNARARGSLSKEFDEFWSIYPRRPGDNRHGAFRAFEKAVKGGDPQAIIAGARRFASAMAGQDRQFIKGSAVWLNNRCWLDDFAPVGPNVLPFGTADPPRRQLSEAEQAERARKFNEDYAAGRI